MRKLHKQLRFTSESLMHEVLLSNAAANAVSKVNSTYRHSYSPPKSIVQSGQYMLFGGFDG